MRKTLSLLTVDQFVELVSGNVSVLIEGEEEVSREVLDLTMRDIIFEYREIVDVAGSRSYLSGVEDLIKTKINVKIFSICENLIKLSEFRRVREILSVYGINAENLDQKKLEAEVKSQVERARSTLQRAEEENEKEGSSSKDIHREFDSQTAALIAYFKFQIDPAKMKATIYANLVARYNKEIRTQLAAMKK